MIDNQLSLSRKQKKSQTDRKTARKRVEKLIPFLLGQNWAETPPGARNRPPARTPGPETSDSSITYHRGGPPKNAVARRPGCPSAPKAPKLPAQ